MIHRTLLALLAAVAMACPALAQPGQPPEAAAPDTFRVKFETTAGPVVVEVKRELAPRGSDRFYQLVNEGFYADVRIVRVVQNFVAQFGMSGDPQTNAKWQEAKIQDDPVKTTNARGTITFATSGKNSRTSQLFINLKDNAFLDKMGFSPFGTVVEGMENVEKFNGQYGEAPDQGAIAAQGNRYLDSRFPRLTQIKTARVISRNGEPVQAAEKNAPQ